MMASILPFPTSDPEAAWKRYQRLASALADDVALAADRRHMEELALAERAWKAAYLAQVKS